MDTTVTTLTDDERAWLTQQLEAAQQFVADYGSTSTLDPAAVQHAWASWLDRQAVDPEDPDPVLNAVGVYFGQCLVERLPEFDWVRTQDDAGVDIAVYGPGDVLIYPANVVAERYQSRDASFLVDGVEKIVQEVGDLRG